MNFADFCFFVGFFGDALLQLICKIRGNIAKLKNYFALHGPLESLFIAGGMMYLFGFIYMKFFVKVLHLTYNYLYLFLYGGILDIIWRQFNLFPSLKDTYYTANNPIQSFIWGGIPMVLPNIFFSLYYKIMTQ